MNYFPLILSGFALSLSLGASADDFVLHSNDIQPGAHMSQTQEFKGFGCSGADQSPHLRWSNPPEGTQSFAVTVYDPDAPTGSGWWHWQLINLPAHIRELPAGAGSPGLAESRLPTGSEHIANDYGVRGFGGACPPVGHGTHRYRFTVHALSQPQLALPDNASGALAGYMIHANSLASVTIEALYRRD